MLSNEGIQRDDLVNKINSAGSRINKSLNPAMLKIAVEQLREFCTELLALLPK